MNHRRRYLVHKKFQLDFTAKILIACFTPMIICTLFVVLYIVISSWLSGASAGDLIDGEFFAMFFMRALPVAFAIFVFSIFFSHRIAGPIRRMQILCEPESGDSTSHRIVLRRRDYFHRLAERLNLLCESNKT